MHGVKLANIIPTSTVDWTGHVSATVFLQGCPLRCPYCCNHKLQTTDVEMVNISKVTDEIMRCAKWIDAVVVSGGEPLAQHGAVLEIAKAAHRFSLKVGMHTSGILPRYLEWLIERKALDAVMLDVKAPLEKDAYTEAIGSRVERYGGTSGRKTMINVAESIRMLSLASANKEIEYYEVRTTVYPGMTAWDIQKIAAAVKGCDKYVLQQGQPHLSRDPKLQGQHPVLFPEIRDYARSAAAILGQPVTVRDGGWEDQIQ